MRIEFDQIEGEGLHFRLGLFLQAPPRGAAELAHVRRCATFLAAVFAHAVQAVDADVEDVVVAVLQADRFLHLSARIDCLQSTEHADAMVDVYHEVAGFQLRQLLQRERLRVLAETFLQPEAVVALEDLVVGVERQFQLTVDEAFVEVQHQGRE